MDQDRVQASSLKEENRRRVEELVTLRLQALKEQTSENHGGDSLDYPDLSLQDLDEIKRISQSELQEIVFAKLQELDLRQSDLALKPTPGLVTKAFFRAFQVSSKQADWLIIGRAKIFGVACLNHF